MIRYLKWFVEEQVDKKKECGLKHFSCVIEEATDTYLHYIPPLEQKK